jgi:hypothetical protein
VGAAQSGRLAGSRRFWVLVPSSMASGFCLVPHRPPNFLGLRHNRWAMGVHSSVQEDHPPAPSLQAGELRRSSTVASSENEKPLSLYTPFALAGRYTLHPGPRPRQVTNFLGLRRLITTAQATHN